MRLHQLLKIMDHDIKYRSFNVDISYWDTPSKIDQCRSFKCVIKHNAPYRIKVANTSTTLSGICIPYTFYRM